jgi:hypothetical protein
VKKPKSYSTLELRIQGLEEYNGEHLYTDEEVVTPTVFMNPLFEQFMKATAPELVKSKEQKLELLAWTRRRLSLSADQIHRDAGRAEQP